MKDADRRETFYEAVFDQLSGLLGPDFRVPRVGQRGQQTFKSGAFGAYWIWFASDGLRTAVYVDSRDGDAASNAALVASLQDLVPGLEGLAGEPVTVSIDPMRRAQWLGFVRPTPDLDDPKSFDAAATWAATRAADLIDVLDRRLRTGAIASVAPPSEPSATTPEQHASTPGDEWDVLQWETMRALLAMTQGWLSIASPSTAHEMEPGRWSAARFVQVVLRDDAWVAECTSNHFLRPPHDLTDDDHAALRRLGWQAAGTAENGREPNDNHWRRFEKGAAAAVAELLVATARDVFGLDYADLNYIAATGDGRSFALPYLRIPMDPTSSLRRGSAPEAAHRFELSITKFRKADLAIFDKDGDHLITFEDGRVLIVRLVKGQVPMARVMAAVTSAPDDPTAALQELNRLNCIYDIAKVVINKGMIVAAADLPVAGLNDESLQIVLSQVVALAAAAEKDVPQVLAAAAPPPRRRSLAGYL